MILFIFDFFTTWYSFSRHCLYSPISKEAHMHKHIPTNLPTYIRSWTVTYIWITTVIALSSSPFIIYIIITHIHTTATSTSNFEHSCISNCFSWITLCLAVASVKLSPTITHLCSQIVVDYHLWSFHPGHLISHDLIIVHLVWNHFRFNCCLIKLHCSHFCLLFKLILLWNVTFCDIIIFLFCTAFIPEELHSGQYMCELFVEWWWRQLLTHDCWHFF